MTRFASETTVSVERSKGEIERLLGRYGACRFMSGWDGPVAAIGFTIANRTIRFLLPLPDRMSKEFTRSAGGRRQRSSVAADKAWEQACRSRWRALPLVIKAKLEAVQCGISTIEDEFLAWTVIPGGDGSTVGDQLRPALEEAVRTGKRPQLLLAGGAS